MSLALKRLDPLKGVAFKQHGTVSPLRHSLVSLSILQLWTESWSARGSWSSSLSMSRVTAFLYTNHYHDSLPVSLLLYQHCYHALCFSLCVSGLLTGAAKFNLSLPHLLQISPSVSTTVQCLTTILACLFTVKYMYTYCTHYQHSCTCDMCP